ncbi:hypothetical protein ABFS82_01G062700 [Erythranthe guttata]
MATPPPTSNMGNIHDSSSAEPSGSRNTDGDLVCGYVSMMGRRRAMEDAVTVAPPGWMAGEYYFFAVYDGHGGAKVAEKCGEKMHKCLAGHVEKEVEVMVDCFGNMDEEFSDAGGDEVAHGEGEQLYWRMGLTAVVVLVGKAEVVVANCGDSRAKYEKQRIEACGGSVTNRNGWRVQGYNISNYINKIRNPILLYLKPYVTSVPEVTVVSRSESDEFLIIATDGLFDVVCNDAACELVKKCLASGRNSRQAGASVSATLLAELAIAKGSKDNISIIVVQLIIKRKSTQTLNYVLV